MVNAEMLLFRESNRHGPYLYYHLLSGVDLPIKTQDYIHAFMDMHKGKLFIGYSPNNEHLQRHIKRCVGRYWVMDRWARTDNLFMYRARKLVNKLVGFIPRKLQEDFRKGTNWVSVTEDCVRFLLENEGLIRRRFNHSHLVDEIFLHTIVYANLSLRKCLFCPESEFKGCMREIDWSRGHPYTWTFADKELLNRSDALFARKFSEEDLDIVYWIRDRFSQ